MNKLAIPALLAATVMIAGIFAFMPVDKATTVDAKIIAAITAQTQGANLVRIDKAIDQVDSTNSVTWTQLITYNRDQGEGAWQIEKLFICDMDTDSDNHVSIGFDIETDIIDANDTGPGKPSYVSIGDETDPRGVRMDSSFNGEDLCTDIMYTVHDIDCASGAACPDHDDHDDTVERTFLGGDEDNNVVVRIRSFCDNDSTDTDGAHLIAYIIGLENAGQMDVSVIDSTDLTGCPD